MTHIRIALVLSVLAAAMPTAFAKGAPDDIKKGDKLVALANLHPDMQRHILYTLNYQLPALIPVCSEITVTEVGKKTLSFTWQGQQFQFAYEGFTEKAGVSFQQGVKNYLGAACDQAKLKTLGKEDQEGIRTGRPAVGMTREGVLFAMGRPPVHANPDLTAADWTYWRNRYVRELISFDTAGKVTNIQ